MGHNHQTDEAEGAYVSPVLQGFSEFI
jgi:hypothetical protein